MPVEGLFIPAIRSKREGNTMADQEAITVIARNLYWGYLKDTTGVPGNWSALNEDGRKLWRAMAKRAVNRIEEVRLQASRAASDPSPPQSVDGSPQAGSV
jgi:hypothetical protein